MMNFRYLFTLVACPFYLLAQNLTCTNAVRYDQLRVKIETGICIPYRYQIIKIYDGIDLTDDGLTDKIVRWQKSDIKDGDTIFYSIYARQKDGSCLLHTKLTNLEPIYFKNYESKSNNKIYDSLKSLYTYPTLTEVTFDTNTIIIMFYTDAATLKKVFFSYSPPEETWKLSREMQWFSPPKTYEGNEQLDQFGRKLEYDQARENDMRIDDFNMLKYINP